MEFTREQLREFNQKGHQSVSARFARDAEKMLEKAESKLHDYSLTNFRQGQVIQELQMKLGFYRNAIRQGQDVSELIVHDVPESWEPNVNYGNSDKPQ